MKKKYNNPKLEITNFDVEDIITTSGMVDVVPPVLPAVTPPQPPVTNPEDVDLGDIEV